MVLSGDDSGVGKVVSGDGVYGLRRALVLAGSETARDQSLAGSDAGTAELMQGYYEGLKEGAGRSEALRQVQLRFLRDGRRPSASVLLAGLFSRASGPVSMESGDIHWCPTSASTSDSLWSETANLC